MTIHANSPRYFPELRLDPLKRYATRWVKQFPRLDIRTILLYHYFSRHASRFPHIFGGIPSIKYVVILEVAPSNADGFLESYEELQAATGHNQVHDEFHLRRFIDAAFTEVYHRAPEYDLRRDWFFIPRRLEEEPPSFIVTEEPHWVLYQRRPKRRADGGEFSERDLDRTQCRAVAEQLWERNPGLTITAVINSAEIRQIVRKNYIDKTLRNWIKDLCPNRKPGRRPKVK